MREKIWYTLIDTKTNEYFTELVLKKYQLINLLINLFIVVFTSSSIISWAIWNRVPIIWAIIVGLTQLLIVIMPLIGLPKYIKYYYALNTSLKYIAIELEDLWYKYEHQKISENDASSLFCETIRKLSDIDSGSEDIIEFNHSKILTKAESKANQYINRIN